MAKTMRIVLLMIVIIQSSIEITRSNLYLYAIDHACDPWKTRAALARPPLNSIGIQIGAVAWSGHFSGRNMTFARSTAPP